MNNENLSFKMKHPIAFGLISIFMYLFSDIIIALLYYVTIFSIEAYGKIKISLNENLVFNIASILFCFLYVCLTGCVHIYKMKSLKEMIKNIYIICLIYMVFLALSIIYLLHNNITLKSGVEMLPGCLKIFGIAFVEETFFRGIWCRYLALKYGNDKKGVILSIFLNGVFFGLMHMINLVNGIPLYAVVQQAIAATAFGFFLGAMYLKSGNLWETITIHFVIDVVGLFSVYFTNSQETFETAVAEMGEITILGSLFRFMIISLLAYIIYLRRTKIKNLISNVDLMRKHELKNIKK